jgi:hypothetical protein
MALPPAFLFNGVTMTIPLSNYLFFSFCLTAALAMLAEGCLVVLLKKQIVPVPTRILYGLGALVSGPEKSKQQFLGGIPSQGLHTYAVCALISGSLILVSSFIYLFTAAW